MGNMIVARGNAMLNGMVRILVIAALAAAMAVAANAQSRAPDFSNFKDRTWVTGEGRVTRVLADDLVPPCHQRFVVADSEGRTVLVVNNIDEWPRLPDVKTGDRVAFRGEFVDNPQGGLSIGLTPTSRGAELADGSRRWRMRLCPRGKAQVVFRSNARSMLQEEV